MSVMLPSLIKRFKTVSCIVTSQCRGQPSLFFETRMLSWASASHLCNLCVVPAAIKSPQQAAPSKQPGQRHPQAPAAPEGSSRGVTIRNVERRHWAQPWRRNTEQLQEPVCKLDMPNEAKGWKGPRIKMSLPSFRWASVNIEASAMFHLF